MTVQELIDELLKVEDKSVIVNVIEKNADKTLFMKLRMLNGMVIIQ